jgi:hypothetical protein
MNSVTADGTTVTLVRTDTPGRPTTSHAALEPVIEFVQ